MKLANKFRLLSICFGLILVNFSAINAEGIIEASAKVDKNIIMIGDQIKVELELVTLKDMSVIWHQLSDSLGKLEIIQMSPIDTLDTNQLRIYKQTLIITSFDSGNFFIPPVVFGYRMPDDSTVHTIETKPLNVTSKSPAIDTTQGIRDIKGPIEEPVAWDEYLIYIVISAGIVAAIFIFYYFWKRRKPKYLGDLSYDPSIPPHVIALEALKQLDSEKLWQKGLVKLYYIRLTEIIRTYIERRFNIPALEMTTPDTINEINLLDIDYELKVRLKDMLELGDLVKFAKAMPLNDENSLSLKTGYDFVYKTIPVEKRDGDVSAELNLESKQ